MQDLQTRLSMLKRPTLLARAARFGADDYRRATHLVRILHADPLPRHADALMQLLDIENQMNHDRLQKNGNYSVPRHVDVLIAIAGEARMLRAIRPELM